MRSLPFAQAASGDGQSHSEEALMDPRIRILLRIINESGGTLRVTSKEISSLLGIGEARLLRLFNRDVGKTLRQHLLDVRMARAAQLLQNVAPPIKAVASDCGYTEVSNFYRDFKRVHGMSPMQMRLRHMDIHLQAKEPAAL
jgi:AraC-like DNA-binding protein